MENDVQWIGFQGKTVLVKKAMESYAMKHAGSHLLPVMASYIPVMAH